MSLGFVGALFDGRLHIFNSELLDLGGPEEVVAVFAAENEGVADEFFVEHGAAGGGLRVKGSTQVSGVDFLLGDEDLVNGSGENLILTNLYSRGASFVGEKYF